MSTDYYYARLEQGRHLSPSESVLDAIAIYTARPGASQEAMRLLASWSLDGPPATAPLRTDRNGTDRNAADQIDNGDPASGATSAPAAPDDPSQENP